MDHKELVELDHQYMMQTYGRFDVDIDHGQGATLYDLDGKEYIDFSSGIGVNSIGYANPKWVEAITQQAISPTCFTPSPMPSWRKSCASAPVWRPPSSAIPAPRPTRA